MAIDNGTDQVCEKTIHFHQTSDGIHLVDVQFIADISGNKSRFISRWRKPRHRIEILKWLIDLLDEEEISEKQFADIWVDLISQFKTRSELLEEEEYVDSACVPCCEPQPDEDGSLAMTGFIFTLSVFGLYVVWVVCKNWNF